MVVDSSAGGPYTLCGASNLRCSTKMEEMFDHHKFHHAFFEENILCMPRLKNRIDCSVDFIVIFPFISFIIIFDEHISYKMYKNSLSLTMLWITTAVQWLRQHSKILYDVKP